MTGRFIMAGLASLILLGACGTSSEPVYYTLASRAGVERASAPRVVLVRRPVVAGYLDREDIVTGVTAHRLQIARGERWASPVADMIGRVLVEDLSARLPESTVVSEPLETTDPDVSVNVDVQRFESGEDGSVLLQASIVLELGRSHPASRSRAISLVAPPPGRSTGALVDSLSVLLSRLADAVVDLMGV